MPPDTRTMVRAHNWDKYDFGSGPEVRDRLNQGPFPQYAPDAAIPTDDVVMTTTPSDDPVPNYGKGLVTYITADMGTDEIKSDNIPQAIEDLVHYPLGELLYIRPTWREVQPQPGKLQLPDYIKQVFDLAKKNNKRIGLRVQMSAPDYTHSAALPDFVLDRVPKVDLGAGPQRQGGPAHRATIPEKSKREISAALRRSLLSVGVPRSGRRHGRGMEWQPFDRIHRHVHVRLLGRRPHLALCQQSIS